MRSVAIAVSALALVACSSDDLPGGYWDVNVVGTEDGCNTPAVQYEEQLQYRLVVEGSAATLSVGPDVFARGSLSGCSLAYASVAWTEPREAGDIRWSLTGEALVQRGDGACGNNFDWMGTEVYTVLSSEDPAVRPGCTYDVAVQGSYEGEVP